MEKNINVNVVDKLCELFERTDDLEDRYKELSKILNEDELKSLQGTVKELVNKDTIHKMTMKQVIKDAHKEEALGEKNTERIEILEKKMENFSGLLNVWNTTTSVFIKIFIGFVIVGMCYAGYVGSMVWKNVVGNTP